MKQIEIKIFADGTLQAQTMKMYGHECQKYISFLEKLTDSVVIESSYKKEFFERNIQRQEVFHETVQSVSSDSNE